MSEISKETIKRLGADVVDLIRDSLEDQNIYYKHNEDNMLEGHALIIGREDTPYHHGAFFFHFKFPTNYPYSPPTVSYYTLDRSFRWNPNLYANRKVCVDILNTWSGNSWTSCQTIRSILMVLHCLVINEKPLTNEPGLDEFHRDFNKYNLCIEYKTLEVAINKILIKHSDVYVKWFDKFYYQYEQYVKNNFTKIIHKKNQLIEKMKEYQIKGDCKRFNNKITVKTSVYSLCVIFDFVDLKDKFEKLAHKLNIEMTESMINEIKMVFEESSKNESKTDNINENEVNHKCACLSECYCDKPILNKTKKIKNKIKKQDKLLF